MSKGTGPWWKNSDGRVLKQGGCMDILEGFSVTFYQNLKEAPSVWTKREGGC